MHSSNLIAKPAYIVPPTDERVLAFADKHSGDSVEVAVLAGPGNTEYASIDAYFGTLVVGANEVTDGESLVRKALDAPEDGMLRLDFVCLLAQDVYSLLRFGTPGDYPTPYDALPPATLALVEAHIAEFMRQPYIKVVSQRARVSDSAELLFADEDEFYEGFIGTDGMPPALADQFVEELLGGLPDEADERLP